MLPGMTALSATAANSPLTATVNFASRHKSGSSTGADVTLTTQAVTVTAVGGSGGYTYAWVRISGSAEITANAPAAAATSFSATLPPDSFVEAVFRCTVTDALGATATVDVAVSISLILIGGTA